MATRSAQSTHTLGKTGDLTLERVNFAALLLQISAGWRIRHHPAKIHEIPPRVARPYNVRQVWAMSTKRE